MPVIVKVDYDNPPKGASRFRSINCNKTYYSYDPEKFTFVQGQSYEITFSSKDVNGRTYHTVTSAKPATAAAPAGGSAGSSYGGGFSPEKELHVTKVALAKSCIEAKESVNVAEVWLRWIYASKETGDAIPY